MSLATPTASSTALACEQARPSRGRVGLYLELTKARLSAMVVLSTATGFVLGAPASGTIDWSKLLWTALGTALVAGCANALNQVLEAGRDARMHRTCRRPVPCGALTRAHAIIFALLIGIVGLAALATLANLAAMALALLTAVLYVCAYTPLKPRTTLNTLVGAVCGAIPPMIGWVAAAGTLAAGAWLLAALLFVWQLPHFLALAWLYRDDYARGDFRMLPRRDATGLVTAHVALTGCLLLVFIAIVASMIGLAGWIFTAGALAAGVFMTCVAIGFWRVRSDAAARRLFRASLIYLSVVLGLLLIDRGPLPGLLPPGRMILAAETISPAP